MGGDRVLDVNQAATRLAVSPDTVRRWCEGGVFPSAFDAGTGGRRHWRIPESDLGAIRVLPGPEGLERGTR